MKLPRHVRAFSTEEEYRGRPLAGGSVGTEAGALCTMSTCRPRSGYSGSLWQLERCILLMPSGSPAARKETEVMRRFSEPDAESPPIQLKRSLPSFVVRRGGRTGRRPPKPPVEASQLFLFRTDRDAFAGPVTRPFRRVSTVRQCRRDLIGRVGSTSSARRRDFVAGGCGLGRRNVAKATFVSLDWKRSESCLESVLSPEWHEARR